MVNEEQKEKEINLEIYIRAINEGATHEEAYELATEEEEEE